ncbi:MAG: GGDEF domain-containing protein [Fulvimarina manganoxydans]|uniref:GGDEF domain-containing protein n=1 Tax=Fulvimarina manganoxydans TaxID=937218 RepID=UPI0023542301|nr:GGDEF domain-containing protein [Fulvimarina manganoxydans]MCK5930781.1 GGDEF domain-containing protein [Fulvimarina manganoxydans]
MTVARSDLSTRLAIAATCVAALALTCLVVVGQPLVARAADFERLTLMSAAVVAGLSTLAALAIAAFWILPAMRRQSQEQGELKSLTGRLERRSQDLEHAAVTDPLTGLHNRRFFDEAVHHYLQAFDRIGRPLAFMLLDLDHFKSINDTYGHDVGDEVLKAVANCLFEFTRHHDIVARLGGEEFAIVAPNMNKTECHAFADRLREAISKLTIKVGNVHLRVTVSVGITISQRSDAFPEFYKRADVNLYNAKQTGRNRVYA